MINVAEGKRWYSVTQKNKVNPTEYPQLNALNFQSPTKHCKKVNAKKCRLIYRFTNIYWF
mgnify:CR=1 FL=1